jgi:NADPH2:quinone reductase
MQAWRVHGTGEPLEVLRLDEIDEPRVEDFAGMSMGLPGWIPTGPGLEPFTDWVVLRMSHAALALPDVTMARGDYPVPITRPYITGQEGVGEVIGAAPAWQHMMGKRVAAVAIQPWGSLASVTVGISMIFEIPSGMTDEQAAGFLIPAHTAYHAAIRRGEVRSCETVVVTGAAGGLGSAIVQLCVAQGARVIAVVGSSDKVTFCESLGAEAVDHSANSFVDSVRELTGGAGVDVVIDPVQGEMGLAAQSLLRPNGRRVLCGHAGGLIAHDPHFYMYNHTLVGATLGSYPREEMRRINVETQEALEKLIVEGQYRPTVECVVDWLDVPEACNDLAERRTLGRVVVRVP